MYKTIIVPLDGSPFAELALATATDLARRWVADLVLARVHESYAYEDLDYVLAEDLSHRDQEEYLARIAERVETMHGLQAKRVLLKGPTASAICDYAAELEAPLVVLSTHGRTGFSRLWLGSVADAIVREAVSPVLMLRHKASELSDGSAAHSFHRILVPLDASDLAEAALPHAAALAVAHGGRLTLVRIVVPMPAPTPLYAVPSLLPEERFEDAEDLRLDEAANYLGAVAARLRLDAPALQMTTDVRVSESVAPAILAAAHAHDADTIVMATHGRGSSRLLVPSVADKIVRGGPDAVLIVRPEAA